MTNLESLGLIGIKVTGEGVADLQLALPNCYIAK